MKTTGHEISIFSSSSTLFTMFLLL